MKISNRVGRQLISIFTTLAISAGALVGLSTAANAADPSPVTITSLPSTRSLDGNGVITYTYNYSFTYGSATEYLKISTCNGSNLGGGAHEIKVFTVLGGVDTEVTSGITRNNCGSQNKGLQVAVDMTTSAVYKITIKTPTGRHVISAEFSKSNSAPTPPATYATLERVTICHRTHATTNPYRMITVSTASIVGLDSDGNSVIRGHAKHATDARRYDPALYGTFDSTKSYRPNAKLWGDIIPPFQTSEGAVFDGLNWDSGWTRPTANGNLLPDTFRTLTASGGATRAQSAVDLCKGASGNLTSKQLFDLERKNGEKRKDILDEIADTDQYEPEVYKEKGNLDKELPAKEGPKNPTTNPIAQSLDGTVWLDINRNGFQENNEPFMANIQVTVAQGTSPAAASGRFTGFGTGAKFFETEFGSNLFTKFLDNSINKLSPVINGVRSIFGMATTTTVYTDKNGYFIFKSLAAGDWYVAGVVPAGLDVTYDSAGVSDATVDTTVPAGGHASTWIGLMGDSTTGIKSLVLNPDGTPATQDVVITASGTDGIFCNADDVSFIIAPVNGVIEMSGLINSSYYVRQIGTTATIADFNIASGTIYTNDIKTVKGTRCALLTGQQLAATGGNVDGISLAALIMLTLGTIATVVGVRKTRVIND